MDKLSFMRAFCRIVELQSFSKAAEDLNLSTALLSKETKLLEESLGCSLLQRSTRSMTLTEQGKIFYEESLRLTDEVDALENGLKSSSEHLSGPLRINAPLSFGLSLLSPLLPKFRETYPEIDIHLNLDDRVLDIIQGGFDISLRVHAELPDSSFIAKKIGQISQSLYASQAYLEQSGIPAVPKDLLNHTLLSFSLADHAHRWILMKEGKQFEVPVKSPLYVSNSLFLRDMMEQHQGIGSLPSFLAEQGLQRGTLKPVLPGYQQTDRYVFAVLSSRLTANPKVRAFINFLEKHLPASIQR